MGESILRAKVVLTEQLLCEVCSKGNPVKIPELGCGTTRQRN